MSQFTKPTVSGAPYNVYVSSVRLTLEEKAIDYDLVPVDIFASEGTPAEHKRRVVYDTGHDIPRTEMIKETLNWLDRYLGPVK